MKEVLRERRKTQPHSKRTAGCVFKNPEGVSAAKLIEQAGLKGLRIGGAEVSTLHANFIINIGEAKAQDILNLMRKIKDIVMQRFGIALFPEIQIVGEEGVAEK
jgi:UDP-N-acetylmuramate dehydrogenase